VLVYIETTIPSYYHETRRGKTAVAWRAATRDWWDRRRQDHEVCTSQVTLDELARAPMAKRFPALAMMDGVRVLEVHERLGEVIAAYLGHLLLPSDAVPDAAHIALATLHGVDVLLSWNVKHIANPRKQRHLETINRRLGLATPMICTPYGLMPE
jgi:predicted nucleic acid-binding protein